MSDIFKYFHFIMYRTPDTLSEKGEEMREMNGCCGTYGAGRSYLTKEEKLEMLTEYQKQLELEAKGVSERIKELKKQN